MSEQEIKEDNTGTQVLLRMYARATEAMENMAVNIYLKRRSSIMVLESASRVMNEVFASFRRMERRSRRSLLSS